MTFEAIYSLNGLIHHEKRQYHQERERKENEIK